MIPGIYQFLCWLCLLAVSAQTPKALTNDDVVQMVKAGLQESVIIKAIKANATAFDMSVPQLLALKKEGVADSVIETMINAGAKDIPSDASGESSRNREPDLVTPASKLNDKNATPPGLPAIYVEEVSSEGSVMASSDTTLEAIKTLNKKGMRVVTVRDKADYILQVTRQLGKKSWRKDTKVALVNRAGEVVYANSTRSIGGAMGDVVGFVGKRKE